MTIVIPRTSTFDAWPIERQKYNLRGLRSYFEGERLFLEIESQDGEEIRFDDEVGLPEAPAGAPPSKASPASKLAQRLAEMHRQALANPGQRQTFTLPGGLRIDLVAGLDGYIRILIARQGVYPSESEWQTVLAHFPYRPPTGVAAERIQHQGWFAMRAGWPSPDAQPAAGA